MAIADTLTEVGLPGSATTLSSPGKAVGASSINVGSTASWPANGKTVFFGIRTVNPSTISSGNPSGLVAGTYTVWKAIVATNSLTNLTLVYGSDQVYTAGTNTQVFIPVDALRHNALVTWGSQDHDLQGHHKTLTDVNGNSWITQSATTSAVDGIQVTNAATGGAPRIDAIGSDTTVPLYLGGKGGEPAHAENPEILSNFVASGGVVAISSGLIGTFSNIVYYIGGKRFKKSSVANKTYTVSKDTYVDIDNTGAITYSESLNGAASQPLAANSIRIAKVVTSGSAITSITQNGADSLGNFVYPIGVPVSAKAIQNPYKFRAFLNTSQAVSAATATKVTLNAVTYDTGNNFDRTTNFQFTAPIAGFYQFNWAAYTTDGTGILAMIYKNNAELSRGSWTSFAGSFLISAGADCVQLSAGDTIQLYVNIASSGTPHAINGSSQTYLSGFLVSAV